MKQALATNARREILIGTLLLLLLLITRSGIVRSHFGTELVLPDASWAVFWLTGALTTKRWWPVLLMAACLPIDYYVIANGVSAYCFTPAYPFLIPAYLSLWAMGRWSSKQQTTIRLTVLRSALSLVAGVSACFVISNIGFFLAAGYFTQLHATQYAQAVARYWGPYLLTSAVYVTAVLVLHYVVTQRLSIHHDSAAQ